MEPWLERDNAAIDHTLLSQRHAWLERRRTCVKAVVGFVVYSVPKSTKSKRCFFG